MPARETRPPDGMHKNAPSMKTSPAGLLGPHGPQGPENSAPTTEKTPAERIFKPIRSVRFTTESYIRENVSPSYQGV